MKINILNCTPHPVHLMNEENEVVATFPKCEIAPRLLENSEIIETLELQSPHFVDIIQVPISKTSFGDVENLPAKSEGILLIVSRMILEACESRNDLIVPDGIVRNDKGHIIGCKSFARN